MKDYYTTLGIAKDASQEDVKKAYRKLAHQFHPDKGGDAGKFKEISEAYQVLSNAEKRAQYDRFGRVFEGADPSGFQWKWGGHQHGEEESSFAFDFGDLSDIFEDFFGNEQEQRDVRRGKDIEVELRIPLEATLKSAKQEVPLKRHVSCVRCQGMGAEPNSKVTECFSCRGTGQVQRIHRTVFGSFTRIGNCPECNGEGTKPESPCNVCKGEGRLRQEETAALEIPAGVDTNQVLKFTGLGEAGRKRGASGDLYVRVIITPHPIFERQGDEVTTNIPLSFSQAALGEEVEVPTLEGKPMFLKVPAGTQAGTVLRMPGKGIPHFVGWGRGDMYVRLVIATPKKLTRTQKRLLEELKKEGL